MKNKIISSFLVITLLVSQFVGCKAKQKNDDSSFTDIPVASETQTSEYSAYDDSTVLNESSIESTDLNSDVSSDVIKGLENFVWIGMENKPYIQSMEVFPDCKVTLLDHGEDNYLGFAISMYRNIDTPVVTEIFAFDGNDFVSRGGFLGKFEVEDNSNAISIYKTSDDRFVTKIMQEVSIGGSTTKIYSLLDIETLETKLVRAHNIFYGDETKDDLYYRFDGGYKKYSMRELEVTLYNEESASPLGGSVVTQSEYEQDDDLSLEKQMDCAVVAEYFMMPDQSMTNETDAKNNEEIAATVIGFA